MVHYFIKLCLSLSVFLSLSLSLSYAEEYWERSLRANSQLMLTSTHTGNTYLFAAANPSEPMFRANCEPKQAESNSNESLWMDYSLKHNAYILACRGNGSVNFKIFPINQSKDLLFKINNTSVSISSNRYPDFALDWIHGLLYLTYGQESTIEVMDLKQLIFRDHPKKVVYQSTDSDIQDIFLDPIKLRLYPVKSYRKDKFSQEEYMVIGESTPTGKDFRELGFQRFNFSLGWHSNNYRDSVSGRFLTDRASKDPNGTLITQLFVTDSNKQYRQITIEPNGHNFRGKERKLQFHDGILIYQQLTEQNENLIKACKISDDYHCESNVVLMNITNLRLDDWDAEFKGFWVPSSRTDDDDSPCDPSGDLKTCLVDKSKPIEDFCIPHNYTHYSCFSNLDYAHRAPSRPYSLLENVAFLSVIGAVFLVLIIILAVLVSKKKVSFYQIRLQSLSRVNSTRQQQQRVGEIEIPN